MLTKRIKLSRWVFGSSLLVMVTQSMAIPVANQGKLSFSPALGYIWFDHKRHWHSSWLPSISLGYYANSYWRVQFRVGTFRNSPRDVNKESGSAMLYGGEGFFYLFPSHSLEPYLTTGLGTMVLTEPGRNDPDVLAHASGGGGMEYFFNGNASVYLGVRDIYTFSGGKNDMVINAGISFFLFRAPLVTHRSQEDEGETGAGQHTDDTEGVITVGLPNKGNTSSQIGSDEGVITVDAAGKVNGGSIAGTSSAKASHSGAGADSDNVIVVGVDGEISHETK